LEAETGILNQPLQGRRSCRKLEFRASVVPPILLVVVVLVLGFFLAVEANISPIALFFAPTIEKQPRTRTTTTTRRIGEPIH
jgi:hypothetical protein